MQVTIGKPDDDDLGTALDICRACAVVAVVLGGKSIEILLLRTAALQKNESIR